MTKRLGLFLFATVFVLASCNPIVQPEEEISEEEVMEENQEVKVSPEVYTPENYYRSVLYDGKYTHGHARGFSDAVVHNRLDLEQLEIGLTRIAQEHFDPDSYYFREGQYIRRDELNSWLIRTDDNNPNGLNPPLGEGQTMKEREEDQPRYLSHILEHNYLVEGSNGQLELAGVVIGLSMNSVYHFRVIDEDGGYWFYETEIDEQKMEKEAQRMADEVVTRLRAQNRAEGVLNDIPIVVALFREEQRESVIPGSFFSKGIAEPGKSVGDWQAINESYYLFPSSSATNDQRNDAERFARLNEEVNGFFDNFIGVVGKGYYKNQKLSELTIEIPIRFYGKTEVVALTQYVADKVQQIFPEDLKIQVYITSISGQESLIVRDPNEAPFIHIYR
ncbi:CamS family sex pheromone protein [Bacillus alkalicellulosilyticus]|uniref:CamS family sex pheromone protein n=1 Tax=Alkalihalobacterium alkalicellulosilyticum TaxID=1912214 RepID=UPI0009960357|nr:CamS family sex pheromone protein [Bacillus alkalicellulosilyticus]